MILLPTELLQYLLRFVEDVDLQTLSRVNRQLRSLVLDKVLWHMILFDKHPKRISGFLKSPRKSRLELVQVNILQTGAHGMRLLREGLYIGGTFEVRTHQMEVLVGKQSLKRRLERHLLTRPELSLNPLSHHMTRLKMAIGRDKLKQALQNRSSFEELPSKITKSHTVSVQTPKLMPIQVRLSNLLLMKHLRPYLEKRPHLTELESLKILPTNAITAWMQCPSIKPLVAFYESL